MREETRNKKIIEAMQWKKGERGNKKQKLIEANPKKRYRE